MAHKDIKNSARDAFRKEVEAYVAKNKDFTIKETGDKVIVWDTSRLTDVATDEYNTDMLEHKLLCTYPSIVIAHGIRKNADITIDDRVYECNLDIIIWNKTLNKKYYTKSEFVKITKKNV
jgi:hypothetical protein